MKFEYQLFQPLVTGAFLISMQLGAGAHESTLHLQGETEVIEQTAAEALWDIFVSSAEASATFSVSGNKRIITANGYPNIAPGKFPNRGNPHAINKKNYQLAIPLEPKRKSRATDIGNKPFGIALNGVLMDPGTAETWQNDRRSGWNYEAKGRACRLGLDKFNAHVQPDGTYHYHGIPTGLLAQNGGRKTPALIGYAADGFPIYGNYGYSDPAKPSSMKKLNSSYAIKSGTRPSGPGGSYNGVFTQDYAYQDGRGDLDQCNGRFAVTPEYPDGTYHYVLTDSFPFIPRCWMGSPDQSFSRLKGGGEARRARLAGRGERPAQGAEMRSARGTGPRPDGARRGGKMPCSGS
ncbi:YHYH protein [Roseibium polysiphoniae]|nr:YHYH protein [Roseibium polysiphoniae]